MQSQALPPGATPHDAVAVIVLAAGTGTRMHSKTPKVLHSIAGRSMLGHSLYAAAGIDPTYLIAVIGHQRERVGVAVSELSAELGREIYTGLDTLQNGTGHAVECGLEELPPDFHGSVLVMPADAPLLNSETLRALLTTHTENPSAAVTILTATTIDPTGYGRILRTQDGEVMAIVEEADATQSQKTITEINSGVYVFDSLVLTDALRQINSHNAQGEFYLTDVIKIARTSGKMIRAKHIQDAALIAGANDRVQLADLAAEFNRRIVQAHMKAGVTIQDPATTWIETQVTIEPDVLIKPGVHLQGSTHIAEDAAIGPDSTLSDVKVGKGAIISRTHAEESQIDEYATVGPFAYLRPGSHLGRASKIGTFVETKDSLIGEGTKVPHLTYVGDATIGEQSNIGASSVFVNYDGTTKNRTVVGSHVRTGSDTMFVAPVHIGDGAYTGAGTVLKDDVPPGALAISGGKQRNIEDWVQKHRPGTASATAAEQARIAQAADRATLADIENADIENKDTER